MAGGGGTVARIVFCGPVVGGSGFGGSGLGGGATMERIVFCAPATGVAHFGQGTVCPAAACTSVRHFGHFATARNDSRRTHFIPPHSGRAV
jgi:hypothetical protein